MYDIYNCTSIEVTRGNNGYPQNLHKGVVGFDTYEDAEKFAEEHHGEVVVFHRRDGWQLWERFGKAHGAMDIDPDDYAVDGEQGHLWKYEDKDKWDEFMREAIAAGADNREDEEHFVKLLANWREVSEAIDVCGDDEVVITSGTRYICTMPEHPMSQASDTHQYEVGVELYGIKAEDIKSLDELADFLNEHYDGYPLEADNIIERNGWKAYDVPCCCKVCRSEDEVLYMTDEGLFEVRGWDEDIDE